MIKHTITFTADGSGNELSFIPDISLLNVIIDNVSLRHIDSPVIEDNPSVNEFLTGTTDDNREIPFRVDTQQFVLSNKFENFVNPLAIITKLQRGTMVKCFIALDDDDFYELEGAAIKGVSTIKVHSKDRDDEVTPPTTREIRISWRDSSKQLCRITQGGVIFLPTEMSYSK